MASAPPSDETRRVKRETARRRALSLSTAVAIFGIVFALMPARYGAFFRETVAFDAAASIFIAAILTFAMHADPTDTRRRAAVEDPGRNVIYLIVMFTAIGGLVSAVFVLGHDVAAVGRGLKPVELVAGIVAVVSGWALIHLVYTLRYAHAYYFDPDGARPGGLKFPGTAAPDDYDFAYFSFVIGMTFQVSDVAIEDPAIRREVLTHALISFAYNTAIIALGVNVASGLLH